MISITLNGEPRAVANSTTVSDLLALLDFSQRPVAVEVNLELVPREQHCARALQNGDRVEVVTLVGGG